MRIIISFLCSTLFLVACNDNKANKDNGLEEVRIDGKTSNADIVRMPISADKALDTVNIAKLSFDETNFVFGEVTEGAVVKHTFTFTNTGNQTLLISDVRTTCGCTVPLWNRNPIPAGGKDKIEVSFDTKGKQEAQAKIITVIANTFPSETEVMLIGFVNPKK